MPIQSGTYQIFSKVGTDKAKLRVGRYAPNDPEVNDSSNQTVFIKYLEGGDTYSIRFFQESDTFFQPVDGINVNSTIGCLPGSFTWAIDSAGFEEYQIHLPNHPLCWTIPEDSQNGTKITLQPEQGHPGQLWMLMPHEPST